MTYTDTMGYAVSTMSSEALAAYEQGVSLWLRQRSGAVDALNCAVALERQRRLGHVDDVMALAQRRLQRNPNHFQSLAALGWAYQQIGQKTHEKQMCQNIVSRAQALSVPDDLPALREARQVLQATA